MLLSFSLLFYFVFSLSMSFALCDAAGYVLLNISNSIYCNPGMNAIGNHLFTHLTKWKNHFVALLVHSYSTDCRITMKTKAGNMGWQSIPAAGDESTVETL